MADMTLSTEDFTLNDIWTILDLVEDSEYAWGNVGPVTYHNFNVLTGQTVSYGDDEVFVEAGFHQLALNAHTSEWIAYIPPLPPRGETNG